MTFIINQNNKEMKLEHAILKCYPLAESVLMKNGLSRDDCIDYVQDATLKLLEANIRREMTFDSFNQFKSYFILTVRSVWMDAERKTSTKVEFNERDMRGSQEESEGFRMEWIEDESADFIEANHKEEVEAYQKEKFTMVRSHMDPLQYFVMTLRMNGWSFKEIAEVASTSLNTALGQMRYGKFNLKKFLSAEDVKRRKRFREGREGQASQEKMFLKLPPYQYFVLKMKETGMTFEEIAEMDFAVPSTIYYRWKLARKNLELIAKSEEDYLAAIEYLDSLNTNTGGAHYHKVAPKDREYPMSEKQKWFLKYIEDTKTPVTPSHMAQVWFEEGGSICRSSACKVLKKLEKRGLVKASHGNYKLI